MARRPLRGAAVVELAVSLPMLMVLLFGVLEYCNALKLKKDLAVAAYEGSMVSVLPEATNSTVEAAVAQVLTDRGVQNYSIAVTPENIQSASYGSYLTVSVSASYADNCIMYQGPFSSQVLTSTSTYSKEQ